MFRSYDKYLTMKKLLILLFSLLISFNSYGETKHYYHSNGQISEEVNYKNDKKDGKRTRWYENGQIWGEDNYKDGKKDGKLTEWYVNGQIESVSYWKDNECISGDCPDD